MVLVDRLKIAFPGAAALVEANSDVLRKAISFALIGIVNAAIDTGVFLITNAQIKGSELAMRSLDAFVVSCSCASSPTMTLIAANAVSWLVAVSCSYVMNSYITFAAESGRKLRWKAYGTFVASGFLGAVANTVALVVAAQFMPVLAAKGCAILAGFGVNFSMSHLLVFRPRPAANVLRGKDEIFQ